MGRKEAEKVKPLPCPFCGMADKIAFQLGFYECLECGAQGPTEDGRTLLWNKRTNDDTLNVLMALEDRMRQHVDNFEDDVAFGIQFAADQIAGLIDMIKNPYVKVEDPPEEDV